MNDFFFCIFSTIFKVLWAGRKMLLYDRHADTLVYMLPLHSHDSRNTMIWIEM